MAAEATSAAPVVKPAWADGLAAEARGKSTPSSAPAQHRASPHHDRAARPTANEPELTWGETIRGAGQNLGSSALDAGKSIVDSVAHPIRTLQTLGELGSGAVSQAQGALGVQQDPAEKARAEKLVRALEGHYGQAYGSIKGFKRSLASDPVGIAMDAATLADGAGAVGKLAGLEKTAKVLRTTSSAVDPIQNAVRIAKFGSAPLRGGARAASSAVTGVPTPLMKVAAEAGATSDPALRQAFLKFYSGQGDATEFLDATQSALGKIRQDASDNYLAKKSTLKNSSPSFGPIDSAISSARAETMRHGINVGQFKEANKALDELQDMVNGYKANPQLHNLLDFDNLKQAVWDLRDTTGNSAAKKHLGSIYNGVKTAINGVDPEYAKLMEQYQTARNSIIDTQKTMVGAGNNPSATTAMGKTLRALKTPTGKNLFNELAEKEPALPYMLAGNALHPWGAKGKAGLLEGLAIPFATGVGVATQNPVAGALTLATQVAGQSPKIAGGINYGAGVAARYGEKAKPAVRGAYYAGKEQEGPAPDEVPEDGADDTWNRMIHQESRGRQTDDKGNVVTSPKGALGIAQVMPGTGPEAARLAGEEWSLERLKKDPEYNERLGRAYYKMLLEKFGDPIKAAAAYNGGPGHVEQAIATGKRTGQSWIAYLWPETRKYVEIMGGERAAFASGGGVGHSHLVERLMKAAESAKKHGSSVTEPLLNSSDDAVAHALEVAQRAI